MNEDIDKDPSSLALRHNVFLWLIAAPLAIWRGYVFSILWRWFIVATFDARPLSISASIGLCYVITMATGWNASLPKKAEYSPLWQCSYYLVTGILSPAFTLLFGSIVNHWM